ncbi:carbohydrate ABC transporter substrate-binding protein, partial [Streptomyces cellulosae]
MGTLGSLRRKAVATAAAVGALSLVVGCSGDSDSVTGGSKDGDKVTITMGLFGVMGIKETGLLEEYEKKNPGVTIKADIAGDEQTYYTALQTKLAAGKGLKDIQGIEIGRAKEITETRADMFADFADVPGTDHFLPWKQSQITTKDGKVLGLGTDIGPMAVCYRKDYFSRRETVDAEQPSRRPRSA